MFRKGEFRFSSRLVLGVLAGVLWGSGSCTAPRQPRVTAAGREDSRTASERIQEIRRVALTAVPPAEAGDFFDADLVDLRQLGVGLRFDIRYATERNFLGVPVYESASAFLQRPAAMALAAVQQELAEEGLGLLVFDAYRPWYVSLIFWQATPPELRAYVADPSRGSRHNRGCAVDLTLCDRLSGKPAPMPSDYDDFSERAHQDFTGGTEVETENRDRLRRAMERHGFEANLLEWWHYDFKDWQRYRLMNLSFADLAATQ